MHDTISEGAKDLNGGNLANPVPEGVASAASTEVVVVETPADPNWLVSATQAWLERKAAAKQEQALREESETVAASQARAEQEAARSAQLQQHINTLARKVGEMEAKLTQIDALGERLADMAGVTPETFDFKSTPGRGGLLVDSHALSIDELDDELESLRRNLAERTDYLSVLDARLTSQAALQSRTPSAMPVLGHSYNSSSYGHRVDPITGRRAFHEGLDFAAPRGTPIVAAAGGVVVKAKYMSGYGKLVEIDHGNQLVTRYAHASKILVKEGDLVYRGQKIATVGSTGRSTGAHLHFEVRVAGQAADPRLFLAGKTQGRSVAGLHTK
nr:peptidoglycan DD-metalloendopeptidase family protein [Pseudomonas sp.]